MAGCGGCHWGHGILIIVVGFGYHCALPKCWAENVRCGRFFLAPMTCLGDCAHAVVLYLGVATDMSIALVARCRYSKMTAFLRACQRGLAHAQRMSIRVSFSVSFSVSFNLSFHVSFSVSLTCPLACLLACLSTRLSTFLSTCLCTSSLLFGLSHRCYILAIATRCPMAKLTYCRHRMYCEVVVTGCPK